MNTLTTLLSLATLTSAHFNLDFPVARGFDEDKLGTFPCGGQDVPSASRTLWPLTGGQIALKMGHIDANVEVLIALGNNPGSAFNTIIRPTFKEQGLGSFCMTGLNIPSSLGAMEGMNATIQVVTNGDPEGGLFNCADITFSARAMMATGEVCRNASAVKVSEASVKGNPNVTSPQGSGNATKKSVAVTRGVGNAWVGSLFVASVAAWAVVL